MDANEIYKGIAVAVEAAKPAQEYCFFWINTWPTCATKSEWASWLQSFGVLVALYAAIKAPEWHRRNNAAHLERMLHAYLKSSLSITETLAEALVDEDNRIDLIHYREIYIAGTRFLSEFPFQQLNNHEMAKTCLMLSTFCLTGLGTLTDEKAYNQGAGVMADLASRLKRTLNMFWTADGRPLKTQPTFRVRLLKYFESIWSRSL